MLLRLSLKWMAKHPSMIGRSKLSLQNAAKPLMEGRVRTTAGITMNSAISPTIRDLTITTSATDDKLLINWFQHFNYNHLHSVISSPPPRISHDTSFSSSEFGLLTTTFSLSKYLTENLLNTFTLLYDKYGTQDPRKGMRKWSLSFGRSPSLSSNSLRTRSL